MKKYLLFIAATLILGSCCNTSKDTKHLSRAEDFGRIDNAVDAYFKSLRMTGSTNELHSVMVLKDSKILAEHYDIGYGPDVLNICWSMSKTFTAAALGFAIQDSLVSVHDRLVDLLPSDKLPANISDTLRALDLHDLLRMSSGLHDDIDGIGCLKTEHPTLEGLSRGFTFWPGDHYKYCSFNTYLIGVVVCTVTGKSLSEYLDEKLFGPLGIHNYHWDKCAEGYEMGGWGLYLTTESLAKMGQFLLQDGMWEGKQLLSKEWVRQMHAIHIYQDGDTVNEPDHNAGYGYQMWACSRYGCYRLDGAHGQWVIICPEKNAVIVITQICNKTRKQIQDVWPTIYDAI